MKKVKTLSEDVYKKIAAGEVVERPLSVVKELVENSIDAGADSVKIELLDGGKRLIRIIDNGGGFDPDDIETAFKNHSTSKIERLEDFDSLHTLGFRGEALPSILEVSRIEIKTSDNAEGYGVQCNYEDAKIVSRQEIAFKQGTTLSVHDLFYNFPVRKKFLKTDRTELKQITTFLEPVVLINFKVGFELEHNGKTVFMYKKAATLKERIYQVFGKEFLDGLQELELENDRYRINGFISRLNTGVSVKKHQFYFVNGRPVREKTLVAALNNTFQRYLEKHRHPVGILSLSIPPQEVDVNIHPMKLEIKFEDSSAVYRFIKQAIDHSMSGEVDDSLAEHLRFSHHTQALPEYNMAELAGYRRVDVYSDNGTISSTYEPTYNRSHPASGGGMGGGGTSGDFRSGGGGNYGGGNYGAGQRYDAPPTRSANDFEQTQLFAGNFLNKEDFILIGQFKNSYIIIERNDELLIIDQHNAQERVNFDQLKKEYQAEGIQAISPLFPVIFELSPSEAAALRDEKMEFLTKVGFRLEALSGNTFDVKSFPQVLVEKNIKEAILEIIHLPEDQVNFEDKILAEVACKSAIKINHKLFPDQMKTIVTNLFKTSNPYFCPHKRPIIIEFSLEKIEKLMKRR